jgi:hypothetical protein
MNRMLIVLRGGLAVLSIVAISYTQQPPVRSLSPEECLSIIAPKAFHSKEELLQIFCTGYQSENFRSFRLDRSAIVSIAKRIHTLFPLNNCDSISLQNDTLRFAFPKPQDKSIPGTMKQASLIMSQKVVFALSRDTADPTMLHFKIVQGSVDVKFRFFARLFGFKRLQGSDLFYSSDDGKRISMLGLNCRRTIPRSLLSVSRRGEMTTINVRDYELDKNSVIVFSPNRMDFFGFSIEALGGDTLRYGKKIARDAKSHKEIVAMIDSIIHEPDTSKIFKEGIESVKSAIYELEARRISLRKGYQKSSKASDKN